MSPDFDHDRSAGLDRELQRLADSASRRAHAPAPGHIRAMGQRRHRRRVAAVAVTTAVATVLAGGVALGAMTGGPRATDIAPQPSPSVTSEQAPAAIDGDDLLTSQDARYALFGGDWSSEVDGEPQAAMMACQDSATAGDPTQALARQFRRDTEPGEAVLMTQLVQRHADGAAAEDAYDEVSGWFDSCTAGPQDEAPLADVGDEAVSFSIAPAPDEAMEVGLARSGRLLVLVAYAHTDSEYDSTPVRALLRTAVARLDGAAEPRVDPAAFPAPAEAGLDDIDRGPVPFQPKPLSERSDGFPCNDADVTGGPPADEPGRLAAYSRQLSSARDNGTVVETIVRYADEATARSAMQACPDDAPGLFGEGADARSGGSPDTMYEGAVRVGTAVAYVRYFRDGSTTESEARAVFAAAAQALERAYG